MTNIDKQYWENRWQLQQTGWDLGMVSPPIKQYIDTLTNKSIRILIPGCGNAYEASYLIEKGFLNVTVIDIAPTLVQSLLESVKKLPNSEHFNAICGDFFEHNAKYDMILEQTFFCAIDPTLRNKYAQKCYDLLANEGKVMGLLFNKTFEGGPPFGGNTIEYDGYFKPLFKYVNMEPCSTSAAPRLGSEVWLELVK